MVLFSILDHYLRRPENQKRVIGTLLGTVSANVVEITNSFAVPHLEKNDEVSKTHVLWGLFIVKMVNSVSSSLGAVVRTYLLSIRKIRPTMWLVVVGGFLVFLLFFSFFSSLSVD